MCLGIPGEVTEIEERHGLRYAKVRFGGITRDVCLECVPEAARGDFVLVHVGLAIAVIDAERAAATLRVLEELGQTADLGDDAEQEERPR